ncbi:glycosyltransferase family 39 protein [bacterium]|nr:glycosyltransferase family 39 protein [bacterium]MBU1984113.1 glycosyltransferase family 39 protein [bacterium]
MIAMLRRTQIILPLLLVLSLAVRIPGIGDSFYGDEAFSLFRDSGKLITDSEDRFRPLFFSLLYLWKQIGFHGEVGLRLLPLLFGLAQIPVAFFVGKRLGGERLARTLALLVACSPILIEFSQELRMYSMVALVALLQVLTFLRALERPVIGRWALFVLLGLIGVYTHFHYWIFLACFALSFYRERSSVSTWKGIAALATVVILYLPNLPNFFHFLEVRSGEYITHIPSALPKLFVAFTVGFNYFELPEQSLGRAVGLGDMARNIPLVLLVFIAAGIAIVSFIRLHVKGPRDRVLLLGHELFTVPVVLALIATLVTRQYWLQPKYLIFSAPLALLFMAQSYLALDRTLVRRALAVCGGAIVVVALLHFWNPQYYGRREDWRGVTTLLKKECTDDSALLLLASGYRLLNYYWPDARNVTVMAANPPSKSPTPEYEAELREQLVGKREIFYIRWDTVQNIADPRDVLPRALSEIAVPVRVIQFNPRFFLYEWRLE